MKSIIFFKSPKLNDNNQIDDSYYNLFKNGGFNVEFIKVLKISNSYEGLNSFINSKHQSHFGLIFTSSNSIKSLESYILDNSNNHNQPTDDNRNQIIVEFFNRYFNNCKNIYIVGESSSSLFKSKFKSIINQDTSIRVESNATNLSKLIQEDYIKQESSLPLLYFCGNNRRDELPNFLKDNAIEFREIIVYNSDVFDDSLNSIKELYNKITNSNNSNGLSNSNIWCSFFSPSGVEYVVDSIGQISNNESSNSFWSNIKVAAIGKTTENSLKQNNIKVDIVSPLPNSENLFNSIKEAINNNNNDK